MRSMRCFVVGIFAWGAVAVSTAAQDGFRIANHEEWSRFSGFVVSLKDRMSSVPGNLVQQMPTESIIHEAFSNAATRASVDFSEIYIGPLKPDTFGPYSGVRADIIAPARLFSDASTDWWRFEVLAAREPPGEGAIGRLWVSTENFRRRGRGPTAQPSPAWEFTSLPDTIDGNARLMLIANVLKQQVEQLETIAEAPR